MVNRLSAMLETRVRSLAQKYPLEQEMATHSGILAWKIPWTEELGRVHPWGRKESDRTERLSYILQSKYNMSCTVFKSTIEFMKHTHDAVKPHHCLVPETSHHPKGKSCLY